MIKVYVSHYIGSIQWFQFDGTQYRSRSQHSSWEPTGQSFVTQSMVWGLTSLAFWELVRNAESQTPTQTSWIRRCKIPVIYMHTQVWRAWAGLFAPQERGLCLSCLSFYTHLLTVPSSDLVLGKYLLNKLLNLGGKFCKYTNAFCHKQHTVLAEIDSFGETIE